MKIGFVLETLNPNIGRDNLVLLLCYELKKKNKIFIFIRNTSKNYQIDGIKIIKYSGRIDLIKKINQQKLDVIDAQISKASGVLWLLNSKKKILTYYGHCPYFPLRDFTAYFLRNCEDFFGARFADILVTISNYLKKEVKKKLFRDAYILPCANFFESAIPSTDKKNIFCLSSLFPYKNQLNLIKMYKKAYPFLNKYPLILAGGGDKRYINQAIKESAGYPIKYLGRISIKEAKKRYAECSFFVFPSKWEGFGLPVLEAQSYGKPVIAFNNSAIKENLLNGKTGYICNTEQDFIKKMILLANNPKLNLTMGKNAKVFARGFNKRRLYLQYSNLLKI